MTSNEAVEAEVALATIMGATWNRYLGGGQVHWQAATIRYEVAHHAVTIDALCTTCVNGISRASKAITARTVDELERLVFAWGIRAAMEAA